LQVFNEKGNYKRRKFAFNKEAEKLKLENVLQFDVALG